MILVAYDAFITLTEDLAKTHIKAKLYNCMRALRKASKRDVQQPFGGTSGKLWALRMGWVRLHCFVLWLFSSIEKIH